MTRNLLVFCMLLLVPIFIFMFANNNVNAQSGLSTEQSLANISERLDKMESQLNLVLENQEKIFYELRRGRYFTKRS